MIICKNCKNQFYFDKGNVICPDCKYKVKVKDNIFIFHPEKDNHCDDYNSIGLDKIFRVENDHFWFRCRKKLIKNYFRKFINKSDEIIEVGAGTGNIAEMLQGEGFHVSVGDIHINGLKYAVGHGIENCYQFDLLKSPFVSEFDVIAMFDVIEHIEDEGLVFFNIKQTLKANGILILTVPAYNFLWNRDDAIACHKQRYNIIQIKKMLLLNGFEVIKTQYFFGAIFPLLVLRKFINKDDGSEIKESEIVKDIIISKVINLLLMCISSIEIFLLRWLSIPFGGSIIAIARKKNDTI